MKNLKMILGLNEIKDGIVSNLLNPNEINEAIEKTVKLNSNCTSIEINRDDALLQFENTLHYDKNKQIYLLESRLFDNEDGQMINAYLEMVNEDLNVLPTVECCIWEYADWEVVA